MYFKTIVPIAGLLCVAICAGCNNTRTADQETATTINPPATAPPVQRDTTYDRYLIDTAVQFNSLDELRQYKIDVDNTLEGYRKARLKEEPDNARQLFILDSLRWHNQDLHTLQLYRQLWKSEKTDRNIILVAYSAAFSNFVSLEDRMLLFNAYPESAQKSLSGREALKLMKKGQEDTNLGFDMKTIGKISIQDSSGNKHLFGNAIDNNAEYTLLIFTASWCSPCRYEATWLNGEIKKLDTTRLKLISISIENKWDKWIRFIRKDANPWPQYFSPGEMESPIAKSIDFTTIPLNLLLDKDKKIVAQNVNVQNILSKWPQLYKG